MVQKVFSFEKNLILNPDWYIKGLTIVNRDYDPSDTIYFRDARIAHNFWIQYGYTHIDSLRSDWGHNANTVINSVNDGREFVLYRGTGVGNWYSPFEVNPYQTSNVKKLPIIISATCQTIAMYPYDEFAGESWLRAGTPTNLKGASAFMGTTTLITGGAHYRSAFVRGFLKRVYGDSIFILGDAFKAGKQQIYDSTGNLSEVRSWQLLGDPEMNIWTKSPDSFLVIYPETIPTAYQTVQVIVQSKTTQNPVPDARVCIMDTNDIVYVYGETDDSGQVSLDIPQVDPCTLYITVTKPNYLAFEGNIYALPTNMAYILYYKDSIIDQNANGFINPQEDIDMYIWLKNIGDSTAYEVSGIIQTDDSLVTIIDSNDYFGDINPHDTIMGQNGFKFKFSSYCEDNYIITLKLLAISSQGDTWLSYINKRVYSTDMELVRFQISDSPGNGNGFVEPGENFEIIATVANQGSEISLNTLGKLSSQDSGIVIMDSISDFGNINPGDSVTNTTDPFKIYADSTIPNGTHVDFKLIIFSQYEIDTFNINVTIGKKHYFVWDPDSNHSSGTVIDSLLTESGYTGDYSTDLSNFSEDSYMALFICVGVYPYNYIILENSQEAQTIENFAQSGGRLYLEGADVWYWDPQSSGHNFCPLFGINAVADGTNDLGPVQGLTGAFTQGMNFNYSGENNWIDHIQASGAGAFNIFYDSNNNYYCGVANDAGTYRTVGMSFELGGLNNGAPPSTKKALLDSIMHFFGIHGVSVKERNVFLQGLPKVTKLLGAIPNPFFKNTGILFDLAKKQRVSLLIYDATGRCVQKLIENKFLKPGNYKIEWNTKNIFQGVYFIELKTESYRGVKKGIVLK
jgi:hypothetical protein